ncbi:hypothetical protein [Providencia burhodogranariea]|uniref:Uncharacterized protein n=1 Tax=Providencia burhodogranariea DSM 19968 TaxID=1141662 RepID=K8WRX7_9GAMM|nr:hypothetical protein OOA_06416 [Providencia burhodogranariea DSM 19968]
MKYLNKSESSRIDEISIRKMIRIDYIALIIFFIIPVLPYILNGSTLTIYSICIMSIYVLGYIFYFWKQTARLNNPCLKRKTRTPDQQNHCAFYIICMLIITFFVITGIAWSINAIITIEKY